MIALTLLENLLIALTVIASWQLYHVLQHSRPGGSDQAARDASPEVSAKSTVPSSTADLTGLPSLADRLKIISDANGFGGVEFFLEGAKKAYELIWIAYASGEVGNQAQLLSQDVEDCFARAVAERRSRVETIELTLVGIESAEIVDAEIDLTSVRISVAFVGLIVLAARAANGDVVAGDPTRIVKSMETWTFERDLRTADPNWTLVTTDTAN